MFFLHFQNKSIHFILLKCGHKIQELISFFSWMVGCLKNLHKIRNIYFSKSNAQNATIYLYLYFLLIIAYDKYGILFFPSRFFFHSFIHFFSDH